MKTSAKHMAHSVSRILGWDFQRNVIQSDLNNSKSTEKITATGEKFMKEMSITELTWGNQRLQFLADIPGVNI